jgi:hypothetical protein
MTSEKESQKAGNLAFGIESDKATKDGACDWRCGEESLWNSSPLIQSESQKSGLLAFPLA